MNTIARIKKLGKHFEIIVELDEALKFRKGEINSIEIESDKIFTDAKKGMIASNSDLIGAFGTADSKIISEKIIKTGEVLTTQEHRDEEKEQKFRQAVDFLSKNCIEPKTGNPHTPERIKNALEQAHINIKNIPIENQIKDIIAELSKILPLKIQTKKIKIVVPALHTGKAYGIITQYKEHENWLGNGDLEVILSIPSGMIMGFYDKLNSITHGSAITEEIKE